MKKILFLFSLVALVNVVKAQENSATGFHIAAGINAALPMGDFNDSHSFGIGIEAQPEFKFSEKFSVYGSAGYTSFFGKTIDFGEGKYDVPNASLIPILGGARFYPTPQFFIGAKAGIGLLSSDGESESAFDYQPQVGYSGKKFEINLGYNSLSKDGESLSNLSLSILYKIK
jgi:hypothetical protein